MAQFVATGANGRSWQKWPFAWQCRYSKTTAKDFRSFAQIGGEKKRCSWKLRVPFEEIRPQQGVGRG